MPGTAIDASRVGHVIDSDDYFTRLRTAQQDYAKLCSPFFQREARLVLIFCEPVFAGQDCVDAS